MTNPTTIQNSPVCGEREGTVPAKPQRGLSCACGGKFRVVYTRPGKAKGSFGELLARIRTALRHVHQVAPASSTIAVGNLQVDLSARRVFRREEEVHLTPLEYKLFVTMLKHSGKVLTHRFLLKEVWGPHDTHETHYLRVFVASLRRKLEDDPARPRYILTEQGVG